MSILLAGEFDAAERAQWFDLLRAALPEETLVTEPTDAAAIDIAIVANPPAGALRGLPKLRLIQSLWAGVDRLLADDSVPPEVPLARMVDPAMNEAMAETALWAVLSLQRDFVDYAVQQRDGRWLPHPQRRADEVRVAVLGLGQMGRAVVRRLDANGYRVAGWSTREGQLDNLLAASDIVLNLLPLTPATRGLFDARRLAAMRRGASLVNLARGAHVVDADLLAALDAGQLRHAVLDVFHREPLSADHPFWAHPRVTVLPHVAAQTDARSAAAIAAANVRRWRAGEPVANLVDRSRGY
ncbi:glyoxylate/hydroxypyruvate reductase A [Rhizobacter sp. AJA081-3]|uniref:2-hydroxyacid dehydrogenase n=1 Tax=Rhizobacter sp. AJA081-3 TaxID=2753607 RepID=UPI001ADEEC68|nr:glyoxylate/hydroxypyruvate reductase A [Rhizobacter sp. AJA081-3]QTN22729.1 glyoxylate/hydroxypyruvate reductase A [Rhizobacter sp. AJA081-3]